MKTIKHLERYCPKCNKYIDLPSKLPKENFERCIKCHSKLTYSVALYKRIEITNPNFNKQRFYMYNN